MKSLRRAVALVTALALVTPVSLAFAQQQPTAAERQEAATRFRKGLDLFKDGDAQAALIEFRRAYQLAPNYQVLYNIGQVSFQLQDYPGALAALQKYLLEGGRNIPAQRRTEVEKDVEKLRSRVANLEVVVNVPEADVFVDDVNVGKSPLKQPVLVGAGKHRVAVSRSGYTSGSKLVEIASQESQKLAFELTETQSSTPAPIPTPAPEPAKPGEPQPATPSTPSEPERPGNYTPAIIGWSATGVVTIGAVITGVAALGASSSLKDLRATAGQTRDTLDSAASKASNLALVTDILGGCALAGAGISIYLTVRPPPASAAASDAAPPATGLFKSVKLGLRPGGFVVDGKF